MALPLLVAIGGVVVGLWALAGAAHGVAALQPLTITKGADNGFHFFPGQTVWYVISLHNPNDTTVYLDNITDTLPSGLTYNVDSSGGLTSLNPDVSGQTLTWTFDGQNVSGLGNAALSFSAQVSADEPLGMYCNEASVLSDAGTSSTGPTGAIQVLNQGDTELTPYCPGNQIVRRATPTFTATSPATATEVPALPTNTPVPPPPTATQPSGGSAGVISAPNTGSGPDSGGPSMLLLAIAGVMVVGGVGAAAVAARRS